MLKQKFIHRALAIILSAVMTVGTAPVTVLGALPADAIGEIVAFEALSNTIEHQEVPTGTRIEDLELPDTLTAMVRMEGAGEVPDASGQQEGSQEDNTTVNTVSGSAVQLAIPVTVTWESKPEFDGEAAGDYLFTPILSGEYVLADGVVLPTITVAVQDAEMMLRNTGSVVKRTTILDLTATVVTYKNTSGTSDNANPAITEITQTAEGWSWYPYGNEIKDYPAKTLVLDNINLEVAYASGIKFPAGSTIVLADGSNNNVTGGTMVIWAIGNLTIKGTGELNVIGTSAPLMTSGIYCSGALTISGGTVTAAISGTSPSSYAVYTGTISITDGTLYAKTRSGLQDFALFCAFGLPNTGLTVKQKMNGEYTQDVIKFSDGNRYVYNTPTATVFANDLKLTKQVINPVATIANITVSGMTGTALSGSDSVRITLSNASFRALQMEEEVSAWFSNLPSGVTATVTSIEAGNTMVTVTFSGTPGGASDAVMAVTIPAANLSTGGALSVTSNTGARFDIVIAGVRTTSLDLTSPSVSYRNTFGALVSADPAIIDITDTSEGWEWYRNATGPYLANTLLLRDINLTTTDAIAVKLPPGAQVVLGYSSKNTIVSTYDGISGNQSQTPGTFGIYSEGNLFITGDNGELSVTGGQSKSASIPSAGLGSELSIFLQGGVITARGGSNSVTSYGIYSSTFGNLPRINIQGGEITAIGGDAEEASCGIYTHSALQLSGGTIYAKSGDVSMSNGASMSIFAVKGITAEGMEALQMVDDVYMAEASVFDNGGAFYSYMFGDDLYATDIKIGQGRSPVNNTGGTAIIDYSGTAIDLSALTGLFSVDSNAGTRTYKIVEGGTGEGSIASDNHTLTITNAGVLTISLETAGTSTHKAGAKVTATLTVNKGIQSSPTGLGKTDVTTSGGNDGKITGLMINTVYEYKKGSGSYLTSTSNASGEIPGLEAGSYVVRFPENALYQVSADSAVITISQPIVDSTPPTGTITIKSNNWTKFLNRITFGLFFKNTVDVTIAAADDSEAAVDIAYYVSGAELSMEEVKALTNDKWTAGSSCLIKAIKKVIIYARLTDNSGNKAYINSNGIVVYYDSTVGTTSMSFTKGSGEDADASVRPYGNTIAKIMNGTTMLSNGSDYTVGDGTITFKASYLESLEANSCTLTVHFNPMGETYVAGAGNDAPAVSNISLTVSPAPTYLISLNPSGDMVFSSAIVGYSSVTTHSVTINNVGNQTVGTLAVTLSGADPDSFTLSKTVLGNLAAGGSTSFTVKPKDNLSVNTYTATVTVSGDNGVSKTFHVNFTVNREQSDSKDVTGLTTPAGANIRGTNITATVANAVINQSIRLTVSTGADWKLYSDTDCNNEITSKTMVLSVGENTAYIKVTAENGSSKKYTLTITRQTPVPSTVLMEGISITGGNTITTKGGSLQLTAEISPANATNKTVIWSLQSGSTYADLSSNGVLTAKANGTVTVRAASQDGSNVYGEINISISGQTIISDNGNGGNTGNSSDGTPSGAEKITVDVKGGNTDSTVSKITIDRTTGSDGKKKDTVTYQKEKAEETVQKLKEEGKDTARIVIPDTKVEVSETKVNIPSDSVRSLSSGEINLQIDTVSAKIDITSDTLRNISQKSEEELYFRLVSIKETQQKEAVARRALVAASVINADVSDKLELLGSPVTIETNMPSTQADITLPLTGVEIPEDAAARKELLKQMAVYIEHSDGEKELVQGELVEYGEGIYGIRIRITKFSVFTLVKTNAFLPSSDHSIISVTSPSDAVIKGTKITAEAANNISSITVKVKVSEKASWKLYSDKACTREVADSKLKLETGSNTVYIKVTAENGTGKTYQLNVIREKSSKALITKIKIPSNAKLKDKMITAAVENEISILTVKADVSSKASWKLYSDSKCTKEIAGNKLNLMEGTNTAYLKVTAENGKTGRVYTLKITRKESLKALKETHVKLGLIGSQGYAEKVADIFERDYAAANVAIKPEGKYYRVTMDFTDKAAAKKVCKDMIKRKYIVNYYFNK